MISTVTTIDNRKFLKEAVRDYLEEYKIERYKREQEEKIEKNVQNLLFEQALSLDDIASGFSVDPFSGEKINMAEVTPPVTKKYAMAKGKKLPKDDPKTVPVIPTTPEDLKRTGKNALKGGKMFFEGLITMDPSKIIAQCGDSYGMIGGAAGSIIGWNLEIILTPILKAVLKMIKFSGGLMRKIFKAGSKKAPEAVTPIGKRAASIIKKGGQAVIEFGSYLKKAGTSVLVIAITLGLLAVTVGALQISKTFSDSDNLGWLAKYGEDNQAINTDGISQLIDFKAIGKTKDEFEQKFKDFSIWDFCRWPSDESQQCFFAGVTAGITARMSLRILKSFAEKGIQFITDFLKGKWQKLTGQAVRTTTGGGKEALEQANLKELGEEISKLRNQVDDLRDSTKEALDRAYQEGMEQGSRLANEGWLVNNAIDLFKPKDVVVKMIKDNPEVFTEEVMKSLGSSRFKMGVWADDPRKGFRIIVDVADNSTASKETLESIQGLLDSACTNRTKQIHNSLGEAASDFRSHPDFVAARNTARAGRRLATMGNDAVGALRHTEIESTLKAETKVITDALEVAKSEVKKSTEALKESLSGLAETQKEKLFEAFDDVAQAKDETFDAFKERLGDIDGLSEDLIKKFHQAQSEVAANTNALFEVLNQRQLESETILDRLSMQGADNKLGNFKDFMNRFQGNVDQDFKLAFEAASASAQKASDEAAGLLDDVAGQSRYFGELRRKLDEAAKQYQRKFFAEGAGAAPNPNIKTLGGGGTKPKAFAKAAAKTKPSLRKGRIAKLFRRFQKGRLDWPMVSKSLKDSKLIFSGTFKIPDELLATNGPLHNIFKNSKTEKEFLEAAKALTDKYNPNLLENKKGIKIMTESNIKELVKELFKENSGRGYSKYPYNSSVRDEEEPKEDYVEEWKSLSIEVIRDETRGTAIEIAKILVEDLELFEDVLDLAGQNQSVGTEILTKLKQAKEKA